MKNEKNKKTELKEELGTVLAFNKGIKRKGGPDMKL